MGIDKLFLNVLFSGCKIFTESASQDKNVQIARLVKLQFSPYFSKWNPHGAFGEQIF